MADETNKATEIKQPENPMVLTVTRNSIALNFTEQRTTRGKEPGKMVFDPDKSNKQAFLDWVGLDNVFGIVYGKVRGMTINWADESMDETSGEFVKTKFISFAEDFSARGETIGELEDQREDAQAELVKLDLSSSDPEVTKQFLAIGQRIQKLTMAINAKQRPRKTANVGNAEAIPA